MHVCRGCWTCTRICFFNRFLRVKEKCSYVLHPRFFGGKVSWNLSRISFAAVTENCTLAFETKKVGGIRVDTSCGTVRRKEKCTLVLSRKLSFLPGPRGEFERNFFCSYVVKNCTLAFGTDYLELDCDNISHLGQIMI